MAIHILHSNSSPVFEDIDEENHHQDYFRRSIDSILPTSNFSLVTEEKLSKLKEIGNSISDPKLLNLYRAVSHYFQMARKNNEYVLWKYDPTQEGLVLALKQNLNGILYYG